MKFRFGELKQKQQFKQTFLMQFHKPGAPLFDHITYPHKIMNTSWNRSCGNLCDWVTIFLTFWILDNVSILLFFFHMITSCFAFDIEMTATVKLSEAQDQTKSLNLKLLSHLQDQRNELMIEK